MKLFVAFEKISMFGVKMIFCASKPQQYTIIDTTKPDEIELCVGMLYVIL